MGKPAVNVKRKQKNYQKNYLIPKNYSFLVRMMILTGKEFFDFEKISERIYRTVIFDFTNGCYNKFRSEE